MVSSLRAAELYLRVQAGAGSRKAKKADWGTDSCKRFGWNRSTRSHRCDGKRGQEKVMWSLCVA